MPCVYFPIAHRHHKPHTKHGKHGFAYRAEQPHPQSVLQRLAVRGHQITPLELRALAVAWSHCRRCRPPTCPAAESNLAGAWRHPKGLRAGKQNRIRNCSSSIRPSNRASVSTAACAQGRARCAHLHLAPALRGKVAHLPGRGRRRRRRRSPYKSDGLNT